MPTEADQIGQWHDQYGGLLLLYARQFLDPAAAEDVVQDVFLGLLQTRRQPDNVKAWLLRSVRNAALNQRRSERRRQRRQGELAKARPAWFVNPSENGPDAQAAQAAVHDLPDRQREIVVLRIWGQMTYQEIAELAGIAASTVFELYRQAIETMRQKMETPCHRND